MFHVLAFDRKGGVWRRGDYWEDDAGEAVRVEELLRERIEASPARFRVPVRASAAGPVVVVEWESAVRSVAVAYANVGEERVAAYLLLPGADEVAEEVVTAALGTTLGVGPGHPMSPAFATVRRSRRRPLLAAFRVGGRRMDERVERTVMAVEQAMGRAYFGTVEANGGGEEVEGRQAAT